MSPGDQLTVNYKVTIVIVPDDESAEFMLAGDPDNDDASWYTPGNLKYWSVLEKNYCELKQGAILDEEFEAMAGTPTTRNLYFATGGNQWVVQATYSLTSFTAQRKYTFETKDSLCKYDYGVSAGGEMPSAGSHTGCGGNQYACFQAAGSAHNGCNNPKKHITGWTLTPAVVKTTPCNCACTHTKPGKDADGNDITIYEHPSGGCEHKNGHCACVAAYYTASSWSTCVASATTWKMSNVADSSCGGYNHRSNGCGAVSDNCKGNVSWNVPAAKYVTNNDDLQSYQEIPAVSGTHCGCCCDGNEGYEHYRHTYTTSENWYTRMTDISAMSIVDLKVWKLKASLITGTTDLFGLSSMVGTATNEPHIYVRRVKDLKTTTGGNTQTHTGLYGSGLDCEKMSAAGRVVYNWFPDEGDTVRLNDTMFMKGKYAGSSNPLQNKPIYSPNTCPSMYKRKGDDSPHELSNKWLRKNYLDYINTDEQLTGHRYGLTVISDYIILCNNDDNIQSIYYNDYTIYAGSPNEEGEDKGISLHSVAKFGSDVTNAHSIPANCIDHYQRKSNNQSVGTCLGHANASYWVNRNGQEQYSNSKTLRDVYPSLQSNAKYKGKSLQQLWLWDFNKFCTSNGKLKEKEVYYGGYNGDYADVTGKYESTDTHRSNMTASQLSKTFLVKRWGSPYSGVGRDTYSDVKYNDANNKAPSPVSGTYDLQVEAMQPLRTATNGLYTFGQSKVFYQYLPDCEYNGVSEGRILDNKSVSWMSGAIGYECNSGYRKGYKNTGNKWTVNDIIVYDPACTEIDVYAYWSPDCQEVIDARDPTRYYGGETVFNIEGDGWLNFPLIGNLDEGQAWGIADVSARLGKGWHNNMDVTEWCQYKYVMSSNYIIVDTNADGKFTGERIWAPGDLIYVDAFDANGNPITKYRFYIPEMAMEQDNMLINFYDEAINDPRFSEIQNRSEVTNKQITNFWGADRDYWRMHDCENYDVIDAVGRIGNLTMVDTGDFRFSNFFKKIIDGSWVVPNVVYQVNVAEQQRVLIDEYDIFHRQYGTPTKLWNTYGSQTHKGNLGRNNYYFFPLRPSYNNIRAFKETPLRIGYDAYLDIETVGNYYSPESTVTIKYSYYGLNKTTGELTPLDVYMASDLDYVKINDFDNDTNVYEYPVYMKWRDEKARRQFTAIEELRTKAVTEGLTYKDGSSGTIIDKPYEAPTGNEIYQGNRNVLNLKSNSRTFIGDYNFPGAVNGFNIESYTNVGSYYDKELFYRNAQKWYFSEGLPSSAVFVKHGKDCNEANISEVNEGMDSIVTTAYIVAKGDTWTLIHDGSSAWNRLKEEVPNLKTPPIPKYNPEDPRDPSTIPNPPTPISINTTPKETSRDDVDIKGTH